MKKWKRRETKFREPKLREAKWMKEISSPNLFQKVYSFKKKEKSDIVGQALHLLFFQNSLQNFLFEIKLSCFLPKFQFNSA